MNAEKYNVIGMMSGTSLDGADLAHITFTLSDGTWHYTVAYAETLPYTTEWTNRLKTAVSLNRDELEILDRDYTILLADIVNTFINQNQIKGIIALCTHGHTVLHQPQNGVTLQIGNLLEIAVLTGYQTVCNFRVQDVAMGGQGAPLVPMGDRLLFSKYDFCLNLGGFSNISFEKDDTRIAFDICAVNTVLNNYANLLGMQYDDSGTLASKGSCNSTLLKQLNDLDYYRLPYPKSLGFEYVKTTLLPIMESYDINIQDKLATFTEHIALQIAAVLNKEAAAGSILVTGGGAYNDFLIERLRNYMQGMDIIVPDDNTIQFKEALIFGLLGVLRLRGEVNVLSSVTGASKDHSSGVIYMPMPL